jgi:hypothetical protein
METAIAVLGGGMAAGFIIILAQLSGLREQNRRLRKWMELHLGESKKDWESASTRVSSIADSFDMFTREYMRRNGRPVATPKPVSSMPPSQLKALWETPPDPKMVGKVLGLLGEQGVGLKAKLADNKAETDDPKNIWD